MPLFLWGSAAAVLSKTLGWISASLTPVALSKRQLQH